MEEGHWSDRALTRRLFSAGVSTASKNTEAATGLISFLASPAAAPVLQAKGM